MVLDSMKELIFSIVKRGPLRTFNLKNTSEKSDFVENHYFALYMQNQSKMFFTYNRHTLSILIVSIKDMKAGYEYILKTFRFWVKKCIFYKDYINVSFFLPLNYNISH